MNVFSFIVGMMWMGIISLIVALIYALHFTADQRGIAFLIILIVIASTGGTCILCCALENLEKGNKG